MPARSKLSDNRKTLFLDELRRHGIARWAARAASPGRAEQTGAEKTFRDERARDLEFARAWDEAVADANSEIEREAHRRAVEGWDEVREEVRGDGTVRRATVRRFSDAILLRLLASRLPEWRHKVEVDRREVRLSLYANRPPEKVRAFAEEAWPLLAEGDRRDVLAALGLDPALAARSAFPADAPVAALPSPGGEEA